MENILRMTVFFCLSSESTDELWIGLNDRKTEGLFDWIDYSVSFTSWEFGKPATSTDIKDCVLIRGEVKSTMLVWCTYDLSYENT